MLVNLLPNCTCSCPLTSLTEGRSARDLTQAAPSKKKYPRDPLQPVRKKKTGHKCKKIRLPEVEIIDSMVIARGCAIDRGMELSDDDCSRQNVSVGILSEMGCSKFGREPLGPGTH